MNSRWLGQASLIASFTRCTLNMTTAPLQELAMIALALAALSALPKVLVCTGKRPCCALIVALTRLPAIAAHAKMASWV
jgi:hypothetical protein